MSTRLMTVIAVMLLVGAGLGMASRARVVHGSAPLARASQEIDLARWLADGKLRAVNREVARLEERPDGVRVAEREGAGVVWIEGTDFAEGTIEVEVRGRDEFQRSFVGLAFHREDDEAYDAVYVRPFNFRTDDPVRRQHAVQYMAVPEYEWPRLRKEFPEEFENPVDPSLVPTDWIPLRLVVKRQTVQVYVGKVQRPTLEVRKLGGTDRGKVGLWTGNNSDGAFANLRIAAHKS